MWKLKPLSIMSRTCRENMTDRWRISSHFVGFSLKMAVKIMIDRNLKLTRKLCSELHSWFFNGVTVCAINAREQSLDALNLPAVMLLLSLVLSLPAFWEMLENLNCVFFTPSMGSRFFTDIYMLIYDDRFFLHCIYGSLFAKVSSSSSVARLVYRHN